MLSRRHCHLAWLSLPSKPRCFAQGLEDCAVEEDDEAAGVLLEALELLEVFFFLPPWLVEWLVLLEAFEVDAVKDEV